MNEYWVQEWAKVRSDEVVRVPNTYHIHEDFLINISETNFKMAFKSIWEFFIQIYTDISISPEKFKMPLHKVEEYTDFSPQGRVSRSAPYMPMQLLFNLLISGDFIGGDFVIDPIKFKSLNKVKNVNILLERLSDYGLFFHGLENFKISKTEFNLIYPDDPYVVAVLKLMADKSARLDRIDDFFSCHYKLFQDDMNTADYGNNVDIIADKMHNVKEQEFIYVMDHELNKLGYFSKLKMWNEGPSYGYYTNQSTMNSNGPYNFCMLSWKAKLVMYLRIRDASKCMEYLESCPERVKDIFRYGDNGCKNRFDGTCKFGHEYEYEGKTYWRCGCYTAPFYVKPVLEDISHYLKLVELGSKK